METIFEMMLTDYFKHSTGYVALIGIMRPDLDELLTECKAHLYVDNNELYSINILGEDDEFVRVNEAMKPRQRSVITNDDIYEELKFINNREIKLVFYKN